MNDDLDDVIVPMSAMTAQGGLTTHGFARLADVPPALTWFANIDNPQTRRPYQNDVREFMAFTSIEDPRRLPQVTRAHVLAWRRDLGRRALAGATIRRKLAALSSLFDALCEANAVQGNPVDGVKRPHLDSQEGKTPAIGDDQARALLAAPDADTLQGLCDHAILATLLYHGLRRAELCALRLVDLQERCGVRHLQVLGKGSKIRYVPLHPAAAKAITAYLKAAGHGSEKTGPVFRPVSGNTRGATRAITPDGFINSWPNMPAQQASTSMGLDPTRCGLPLSRMPSITRPISRRSRNGWDMPISRPRGCTTSDSRGPRRAQNSR